MPATGYTLSESLLYRVCEGDVKEDMPGTGYTLSESLLEYAKGSSRRTCLAQAIHSVKAY